MRLIRCYLFSLQRLVKIHLRRNRGFFTFRLELALLLLISLYLVLLFPVLESVFPIHCLTAALKFSLEQGLRVVLPKFSCQYWPCEKQSMRVNISKLNTINFAQHF